MAKNSNDKGMKNSVVNKRDLLESATPGFDITKKNQKATKKDSEAYYKEVTKKVNDTYGKETKPEVEPIKRNYTDAEKELHDELEIRNGLEMIEYDNEPDETFKKRAKAAIEGDSIMGNKGDEGGNTDPVWGSHDKDFGKNLVKTTQASKKKRDDAKVNYVALGDDMELNNKKQKVTPKKLAFENYTHFVVTDNKIVKGLTVESGSKEAIREAIKESLSTFKDRVNAGTKTYSRNGLTSLGLSPEINESWINGKYEGSSYDELVSYKNHIQETHSKQIEILNENHNFGNSNVYDIVVKEHNALLEEINGAIEDSVIRTIQTEGFDPSMTHFVMHKDTNSVVFGKNFTGKMKNEMLNEVVTQLKADFPDLKANDVKVITKESALKNGIALNETYLQKLNESQGIVDGKIKSLKFKNSFGGIKKALTLIPESYKVNMRKFEMTDGNETYLIRWEGSLNEGHAVVLNEENAKVIQESFDKVKHLIAFDGLSKMRMTRNEKEREDDLFKYSFKNIKKTIAESKAKEQAKLMTESVQEKPVKEKFTARQLDLSDTASKYAEVKKAQYLKEGSSYEGIVYEIQINESVIPANILAEDIAQSNKNKKPADRVIKFRFTKPDGSTFEL